MHKLPFFEVIIILLHIFIGRIIPIYQQTLQEKIFEPTS